MENSTSATPDPNVSKESDDHLDEKLVQRVDKVISELSTFLSEKDKEVTATIMEVMANHLDDKEKLSERLMEMKDRAEFNKFNFSAEELIEMIGELKIIDNVSRNDKSDKKKIYDGDEMPIMMEIFLSAKDLFITPKNAGMGMDLKDLIPGLLPSKIDRMIVGAINTLETLKRGGRGHYYREAQLRIMEEEGIWQLQLETHDPHRVLIIPMDKIKLNSFVRGHLENGVKFYDCYGRSVVV